LSFAASRLKAGVLSHFWMQACGATAVVLILENRRKSTPHACTSRWSSTPPVQRDVTNAVDYLYFTKQIARIPAVNL